MPFTTHFFGNEISEYGRKNGRVDYRTLAKSFECILNNNIISATGWENWETVNGCEEYYEDSDGNTYDYSEAQDRIEELNEKLDELDEDSEEYAEIQEDIRYLEDPHYTEIYQYYIINEGGAEILQEYTNELVMYNSDLDLYVWCVDHWGTSWDYVLTEIPCEKEEEN